MNEIGVTGFGFGSTKDTTGIQTMGYGYFMRQFLFIDTNMRIVYQQSGGQRGGRAQITGCDPKVSVHRKRLFFFFSSKKN